MDWLPLWNRVLFCHKVQSLDGDTFKGWFNLLIIANICGDDGVLPSIEDTAQAMPKECNATPATVQRLFVALCERKLIDPIPGQNQRYAVHDWNQWRTKGKTSTERSRLSRERNKEKKAKLQEQHAAPATLAAPQRCSSDAAQERERERKRERETPPTPPHRGAAVDDELEAFGREALGDRFDLEEIGSKLRGWRAAKYPEQWIKDALLVANCAAAPGGMASYVNKCLIRWTNRGGPDPEEVRRAKPDSPPATIEYVVPPKDWDKPPPGWKPLDLRALANRKAAEAS